MEPGTIGVWTGEKWAPGEPAVKQLIRDELRTIMAAALADPNLGDESALLYEDGQDQDALRSASKALAGFMLERLSDVKETSS